MFKEKTAMQTTGLDCQFESLLRCVYYQTLPIKAYVLGGLCVS